MDTETIRGLLTCKPFNAPSVNQIQCFLVIDKGNYTKIARSTPDKGGQYYTILTAEKTNYSDANGNVSYNVDIEPANAPAPQLPQVGVTHTHQPPRNAQQNAVDRPVARSEAPAAMDSAQQHIMRTANLYCMCLQVASTTIRDFAQRKGLELSVEDIRQIATHLNMNAAGHGYIAHMPDSEQQKNRI